jgi:predicted Zn finger-like uncharacterized protein
MIIVCPKCSTKFDVNPDRIPDRGAKVRCARCKHVFTAEKTLEQKTPPAPIFKEAETVQEKTATDSIKQQEAPAQFQPADEFLARPALKNPISVTTNSKNSIPAPQKKMSLPAMLNQTLKMKTSFLIIRMQQQRHRKLLRKILLLLTLQISLSIPLKKLLLRKKTTKRL